MTQKMCDKAVNTYPYTTEYILDYYKTQEKCDKAVNTCFFVFDSIHDGYKTQEMCDRVVSEDPFLIVCFSDKNSKNE